MRNLRRIFLFVLAALSILAIIAPATASASAPQQVFLITTQQGANSSLAIPLNSSGATAFPVTTASFFGVGNFRIIAGNLTLESGYVNGQYSLTFSLPSGIINLTVAFGSAIYHAYNLTVLTAIGTSHFQEAYVVSTLQGQNQQLFAYPGQVGLIMYPVWNITLVSSTTAAYSVYVGGRNVSAGTFVGIKNVVVDINTTTGSATVGIGNRTYLFSNLAISQEPLQKRYAPPVPPNLYTQAFLELFQVKTIVAAVLLFMAALLAIGGVTKSQMDREIQSG